MAKKKHGNVSRTSEEIQESGNILLNNVLEEIRQIYPDLHIVIKSEEDQKDRGVDFQVDLIRKPNETVEMFKLQVKATDEPVTTLKNTRNKGLISFPLEHRHIKYYKQQMPWALIFIVCDNSTKTIYWHPIQLDYTLEERLEKSIIENKKSLQLYIDPENRLTPGSFLKFLGDVEASKTSQFFKVATKNENSLTAGTDFQVDRNKPLLEQLYNVIEYLYEEVQFVPINLLIQYYPFKIFEDQPAFYQQFKLYTDNEDLVAMLDTFSVQPDGIINFADSSYIKGVKDYQEKAKTILSKFSQNHIYSIVSHKSRKEVSTRYFNHSDCNCVACCYNRLEIPLAMEKLSEVKDKTLDEQMVNAYMHYTFGDFLKSAKTFEEIGRQAFKDRKKTLFMITQFNLIKLGKLIRYAYYDRDAYKHGKALMEINLDQFVYKERNRSHHQKLFNYIKDVRFYSDNAYEIQTAMSKLRNEYQSFIEGGNFITHSYDQLFTGFAQLNSFISGNRIIYDRFSEFHNLMDEFTEGLFIALALRETNSNVITEFNDYHINQLIFDGDHKLIWRYFNKYHFKSIPYNGVRGKFFEKITNLLGNHYLFIDSFKAYTSDDGSLWRNLYPKIFNNCLSLAAMLQMNDSQAEKITREIIDCISKSVLPSPDSYAQINSFFGRKRSQLSTDLLKELIFFFLQKEDMYLETRLSIFIAELKLRNQILIFSQQQRKNLMKLAFDGKNDKLEYFNTLIYFHPVVDNTLKTQIKRRIITQLHKKFKVDHYYNSAIFNVLPFKESEFLQQFIEATFPNPNKHSFKNSFYGPQDNDYPLFDMFLNLCFKFNIQPNDISNKNFKGFGDYYDWLQDLESYDYEKFKISWLGLYPTKYYFNHFAKSKKLEKAIKNYLRNNRDQKIERLYFDIYNPQIDEVEELF
ncbi:hypothetical protein SF1_18350 [Sphingobacterium faecium NBRC 15299]|uniref:DUF4365 domain-containing protein n=1 Tax=Sphingobacterium faecium TaxID=34087 RepID=UPI000D355527|nr:DUF4365 domain-containing protein [Sphingobacterium faecium]PTX09527.1 uncharacterized protein DUF4365 [Sphingobacterium faecium]GEM63853.1 hypothetical protein SF1_18350 [Sphingobacterium faecium NBRC 15299]